MRDHTSTPWTIGRGKSGLSLGLFGADGRQVASSSWHDSSPHYPTQATTVANFEFIADVVNSHASLIEERDRLREALQKAQDCLEGEPTYHHQGMGCGLEDRNITDRYDAMEHGWECAMERVYGEHINGAREVIESALSPPTAEGREA